MLKETVNPPSFLHSNTLKKQSFCNPTKMPTKMNPSSRKPPLARSPIRLRSRRVPQSPAIPTQTTPPGSSEKTNLTKKDWDMEVVLDLRPEYVSISCEMKALAEMVHQGFGQSDAGLANPSHAATQSPLFERGRFYDEYSARRTERLKRKKGEEKDDKKQSAHSLGVRVASAKKREVKKFESVRRTVPSTPGMETREASSSRYSLRSAAGKENKKLPIAMNLEKSAGIGGRTSARQRIRKN